VSQPFIKRRFLLSLNVWSVSHVHSLYLSLRTNKPGIVNFHWCSIPCQFTTVFIQPLASEVRTNKLTLCASIHALAQIYLTPAVDALAAAVLEGLPPDAFALALAVAGFVCDV